MKIAALGRLWSWPEDDTECLKVVFSWASDLDRVYPYVKNFRTAIQAGGNMGVWPWLLSKKFQRVITAEPDAECYKHMAANLRDHCDNVTMLEVAFGEFPGTGAMQMVPRNRGAQFVTMGGDFPIGMIDSLEIMDCDLIYLDVEGFEMSALKGAVKTIVRTKPCIVVEDKGLMGTRKGDIERWLDADFGYKVMARPHRDVVMQCV